MATDYPPAAMVGRGRFKHLFGPAGLFNGHPQLTQRPDGGSSPYTTSLLGAPTPPAASMVPAVYQRPMEPYADPYSAYDYPVPPRQRGGPRVLSRFKTKLCSFFMDSGGRYCPFGPSCQFAHGHGDLRVPGAAGRPSMPQHLFTGEYGYPPEHMPPADPYGGYGGYPGGAGYRETPGHDEYGAQYPPPMYPPGYPPSGAYPHPPVPPYREDAGYMPRDDGFRYQRGMPQHDRYPDDRGNADTNYFRQHDPSRSHYGPPGGHGPAPPHTGVADGADHASSATFGAFSSRSYGQASDGQSSATSTLTTARVQQANYLTSNAAFTGNASFGQSNDAAAGGYAWGQAPQAEETQQQFSPPSGSEGETAKPAEASSESFQSYKAGESTSAPESNQEDKAEHLLGSLNLLSLRD